MGGKIRPDPGRGMEGDLYSSPDAHFFIPLSLTAGGGSQQNTIPGNYSCTLYSRWEILVY
jgi:hypothetical protein